MQGVTQPKNEEFSLSSGDFPTLGSDKDKSVLNSELQGIIIQSYSPITIPVIALLIRVYVLLWSLVLHFLKFRTHLVFTGYLISIKWF